MPPRGFSRYVFTSGILDDNNRVYLTSRKPFRFVSRPDNVQHQVKPGDSIFTLALKYYRNNTLWWVIADFQPDPLLDPTLDLTPGSVVFIPSFRTVREEIFNEHRREERSE